MVLKEPDLGPFLAHLVDGLERILIGALVTVFFVFSMVVI